MRFFAGLVFLVLSSSGFAQYTGPAILSRGDAPSALTTPQVDFRPYVEAQGVYESGLAGVAVTPEGHLADVGGFGLRATWGISGTHSWRHSKVGLDYRGVLTHYDKSSFDSVDQSLLLGLSHQFSPHTLLAVRESAGTYARNYSLPGLSQTVPFDPIASYIPSVDFFDNRTYYLSTQVDFTVQRSARLSYNLGGDGFVTLRRSKALTGLIGAAARGDVEYRISRRQTIGAVYNYAHYDFRRGFGGTDAHGFNGAYSARLTRNLEFSGYAGVMRVESKFIQAIPIDPVIAILLGITSTPQVVHTIKMIPNIAGRLSKRYSKGVLFASGGHSLTPGNGMFLTSYTTNVLAGYTYTGLRRWSFSSMGAYNRAEATGAITGIYITSTASIRASRELGRSMHVVGEIQLRRYSSPDFTAYNRTLPELILGIGYTPGSLPFRLW